MSSRVRNALASLVLFLVLAIGLLVRLSRLPRPEASSPAADGGAPFASPLSPELADGGPGR